ncbi:Protein of unknown function [Thermobacillus xylanilyticus]|uniref:Uncharacterized protein n=1 Tax=Thermobacillus xylanilyticus TaxID=76633 RepID=A0ABM8V6R3_THEXY|nr:Protein of unknown function [Thermobacillus xylanilyticus]
MRTRVHGRSLAAKDGIYNEP